MREILRKNESFLRRHLVLSKTVLDKLHDKGLITDIIRRKILMYPHNKQVPLLLESLENQGLPSLRKFLVVLKDTGHGYLVDTILDTEAIPVGDVRPDTTNPRAGAGVDYVLPRPVYTVHSPRKTIPAGTGNMASLGSLLRMRKEQETETRGTLVPRTLLSDPMMTGYAGYDQLQPSTLQPPARREDVPGTLYNLGQVFNSQQKINEEALVVLRQEEMAIKQLMEQNARDQQKVRRKQFATDDMKRKLSDINARASEMYEPAPHPSMGRYRLAQLNQIPWSVDH